MASDFPAAFNELRSILKKHSDGMIVLKDTPVDFTVITKAIGPNKKPIWFGAVLMKKSAVTLHLVPLYYNPKLEATISPELAKRKQGKACLNFQRPDPALFQQIDELIARGRAGFARHGMLGPGVVSADQIMSAAQAAGVDTVALAKTRKEKGAAAAVKRAATIKAGKKESHKAGRKIGRSQSGETKEKS